MGNPNITCRGCNKRFNRLEWLQNKSCSNPNCKCPEVQKLIDAANSAISKAQESSATSLAIHRGPVPHGYDATSENGQYFMPMPDVKVITITPIQRKK